MVLVRSILLLAIALLQSGPTTAPATAPSGRTVWDGLSNADQIARGKRAYSTLCARCHGETFLGNDDAPPLVGAAFLKSWEGKSVGSMVEYTREEMPTDGPGKLTRRQCTDITAYVLNSNGFPVGQGELVPELEVLNAISIKAKK